jgi:NAD(P)-dependent dehydrogenase (short-subunit alcohol dehydrogenase family)
MKYEIPRMLNNGGGAIVNTSSVGGLVGNYNISPYIASKHGVVGLTKAAALDYAKQNIRVNAIAPAGTETAMLNEWLPADEAKQQLTQAHPIGRIASPEEVAKAALWLCSDAASFVTGQTLAVDGGYTTQ